MRKLSGFTVPSKANEQVFEQAVAEVAAVARQLIDTLKTNAPPRNREVEALRAKQRSQQRSGASGGASTGA